MLVYFGAAAFALSSCLAARLIRRRIASDALSMWVRRPTVTSADAERDGAFADDEGAEGAAPSVPGTEMLLPGDTLSGLGR